MMGTIHLLLVFFLLTDNSDARPFYDDADENNAKFLEAILYEKTDTLRAAIALLSQLNLPLLCQSVASDPHAQFATVADLLHFATVVVQAQENGTFSSEQATTVSTTIPFDKITSVYPKAVTETVTKAADNSKEPTFPKKKHVDNDYKPVHDMGFKERANGRLLSKDTVVVKSVDSIYGDNDLESAARLKKNKAKSSERIKEESVKLDIATETTEVWSTRGDITSDLNTVVQSTEGNAERTTEGLTLPTAQTSSTTRIPTDVLDVTASYGDDIPANQATLKIKRPQNTYLDRSDQKPSSPTSAVSNIQTTTPLHWLIRDKWPEMEQRTLEMLKEGQLTSEELSSEIISALENDTAAQNSSSVELSRNTSNHQQTATNSTESITPTSTPTTTKLRTTSEVSPKPTTTIGTTGKSSSTKATVIAEDTQPPNTTNIRSSMSVKQTKTTVKQTTTFSTPIKQTSVTLNQTTTQAKSSSSPVTTASSIISSSVTRAPQTTTETTPRIKTDSTILFSTLKPVNVTSPTSTKISSSASTSLRTSSTATMVTQHSAQNTTDVRSITTPSVAPKKKTTSEPKPTRDSKSPKKTSTLAPFNVTKILELTKTASPVSRSATTQVTIIVKPSSDKTSPSPVSPLSTKVKQKHITLNSDNRDKTTSPTPTTRKHLSNDIGNMTKTTLTENPNNVSYSKTITKATTTPSPKTTQVQSSTRSIKSTTADATSALGEKLTSTKIPSINATTATKEKTSTSTTTTGTTSSSTTKATAKTSTSTTKTTGTTSTSTTTATAKTSISTTKTTGTTSTSTTKTTGTTSTSTTTPAEKTSTSTTKTTGKTSTSTTTGAKTAKTTQKISTSVKVVSTPSTIKKQDFLFRTKGVFPWELDPKQKPTLREKIVPVQNSRDTERTDIKDYGSELTEDDSKDENIISPGQTEDDNFGFFTCPTIFGFYPDAINCGQFYICSWSIPYHFDCPVGTVWNTELTVCDWPFNVNCGTRPWFGRTAFEKHFLPRQL